MNKINSISDYQTILANHVLANSKFSFNPRPSAYVKQGMMYTLKRNNGHIYCGIQVDRFRFFDREYGTTPSTSKGAVYTKGYAEISSTEVKAVLKEKIIAALQEVTGKADWFLPECDVVLRLNGISSCLGGNVANKTNPHFVCSQAKENFESLENVNISSKHTQMIPCLFDNLIHSHNCFNNLKIFYDDKTGRYRVCNEDDGTFTMTSKISPRVEDNFYMSLSNSLSGIINIKIIGIYMKDTNSQGDTIKIWANLVESNLLTPFSEKAEFFLQPYDDLADECYDEETAPLLENEM